MSNRNWLKEAESDAYELVDEFVDEMVEQWKDYGKISDDLNNDYRGGDSSLDSYGDGGYTLLEAAEVLDALSNYEVDDSGLWEGLPPRDAIEVQAAYTYRNAVAGEFADLVDDLNGYLDTLTEEMEDATIPEVQAAAERLIRLFALIGNTELSKWDGLLSAAFNGALSGDRTATLVLADKIQEEENDTLAKAYRDAVSAEAEAEEETDDTDEAA